MTEDQWKLLISVVHGEIPERPLSGFIIDSPWLPGWSGYSTLQYFASEEIWFEANRKAVNEFPEIIFLPGFWAEFGMCTEPSAFGSKIIWNEKELPYAEKIFDSLSDTVRLKLPDPRTDGLLPLVIQRLLNNQLKINKLGHQIKFAVVRGPLNIASFLLGMTEFMTGLMMDPERSHKFLESITQFSISWIQYQKKMFPSVEGILLLDDIVGFIGDDECREYALPYISRIFKAIDSQVNFFHNDAGGLISSPYLKEMGVNLFNFSFEHSMTEIRELAGPDITLLGNLPPRDILASGTPATVKTETVKMISSFNERKRVIWSCGGGMPPGVPGENIRAFVEAVNEMSSGNLNSEKDNQNLI
ncbi:MAG: uroporphyrinogen decarboxylase family protein [Prolixibacteraceae bacterium]|jgi:uroporphyrinogen decarboxylase|nr:uroporphyrinogen decarboxylase family protein [Prolixibacteraceae bacterium]